MSASVAVIGLGGSLNAAVAFPKLICCAGALGLVAVKNLVEEGFEVTGFDRNKYPGGLWKYTEEEKTSVLKSALRCTVPPISVTW